MNIEDELLYLDCSKICKFSLMDYECIAKVVSVYDGDTISVIFKYKNEYHKWNCRLDGVDTPEMKSKSALEKAAAIRARDFLREQILGKLVKLKCGDFDKYGRLLVQILKDGECVNESMIQNGHAKVYTGGAKEEWVF